MRVVQVSTKKELIEFIRVPWRIYRGDPNWVPPIVADMLTLLNKEKNPFFKHADADFFYITDDLHRPLGRIAAIYDRNHFKFRGENVGYFGYFECVDDDSVAEKLFELVHDWHIKRGSVFVRGPINLSMNNECGLLIEGFDGPPLFMMTYNPQYYAKLIENNSYKKVKDLYAYWIDTYYNPPEKVFKLASRLEKSSDYTIRNLKMKEFDEELKRFQKIYNEAWKDNWGFVPLTEDELKFMAKRMKMLVLPDLVAIAEKDGNPVGVAFAMPDYNFVFKKMKGSLFPFGIIKFLIYKGQIPRARFIALGVVKEYRYKGLEVALIARLLKAGMKRGYIGAELSWTLEDNKAINSLIEKFGGKLYRRYRIYEKKIR